MANKKKKENLGYRFVVKGAAGVFKLLLLILCLIGIAALGRFAYVFGYSVSNSQAYEKKPGTNVVVDIAPDADIKEIATELKHSGVIADAYVFMCQERLSSYHGKLKGGNYRLNSSMTPDEIMQILAADNEENTEEGEESSQESGQSDGSETSDESQESAQQ